MFFGRGQTETVVAVGVVEVIVEVMEVVVGKEIVAVCGGDMGGDVQHSLPALLD